MPVTIGLPRSHVSRRYQLRAARERTTRSHFLGGLMSFQNLTHTHKSTRRVARLLFSREVLSHVRRSAVRRDPGGEIIRRKTPTPLQEARGRIVEQKLQQDWLGAPLSAGKGGWTFSKKKKNPINEKKKTMNRSFNKSQPLRNADCNAVEVKSKVSVEGWVFFFKARKCGLGRTL